MPKTEMGDENVTKQLLGEFVYRDQRYAFNGAPAKPGKLSKAQSAMLERFSGARMGFVSKALQFADQIRRLSSREHRALISLLKGGVLAVMQESGSLRSVEPLAAASLIGADEPYHYRFEAVE